MTFSVWTFLFEILNFVVLAYVLHRLLYRPLQEAIQRRRESTEKAQAAADAARHEAEVVQERLQAQLNDLERQRQVALRAAREEADGERKKLLAATEQELQKRREESRLALERERREALNALQGDVIAQAIDLTRRLLHEAADQSLHRQLVLRLAQTLTELPEAERERLRGQWDARDGALLETAQPLDDATRERVAQAVTALLGKQVSVTIESKPALLGGARLRLGGQVWDGSLLAISDQRSAISNPPA